MSRNPFNDSFKERKLYIEGIYSPENEFLGMSKSGIQVLQVLTQKVPGKINSQSRDLNTNRSRFVGRRSEQRSGEAVKRSSECRMMICGCKWSSGEWV
ncbi:hypothetical protein RHGRI_028101 [Rhododendron griersonianum]|uniref:Uncharacterized protein n=1 Tax=Rhododendron griersonianum TaxID=479676 RepID=A0AAV6IKD0_9ERIC|nr:hypothetical protein RHGRI_028101 [Rhododendron griersonianum]